MTIFIDITNANQQDKLSDTLHLVSVRRVTMDDDGEKILAVEEPTLIGPNSTARFTIWKNIKLGIEEESISISQVIGTAYPELAAPEEDDDFDFMKEIPLTRIVSEGDVTVDGINDKGEVVIGDRVIGHQG